MIKNIILILFMFILLIYNYYMHHGRNDGRFLKSYTFGFSIVGSLFQVSADKEFLIYLH